MALSDLPAELILKISKYLTLREHVNCLLTSRDYEKQFSTALYARLASLQLSTEMDGKEDQNEQNPKDRKSITRKHIMRWAIENGRISTLRKIDEIESLVPFINTMTFLTIKQIRVYDFALPLLALHLASLEGHHDILRFLLERGANVNAAVGQSRLPIHFAKTADVVNTLLSHGSHLTCAEGYTPLIHSLLCGADSCAAFAFINAGCDPHYIAPDGTTAAVAAIEGGQIDALKALLDAGVPVGQPLARGEHLLYYAIWSAVRPFRTDASLRMVQMLLDYGADPNSGYESVWGEEVQEQCYTPYLLLAAMMPNTANIFEALIDRGADIHVKYTKRRGLLDPDARVLEGFEVVWADTLLPNIIESAVRSWHAYGRRWTVDTEVVRKLELLVRHGISIDSEMGGLTPLHYCLLRLRTKTTITMELIPHIIALGADVRSLDPNGSQPLHLLTKHVYTNELENRSAAQSIFLCRTFPPAPSRILMDLMIDNGADPNAVDADGQTPLMHLCRQPAHVHTASLMKALLGRQGIDVNMTDKSGCTALHHIVGEPNAAHHHEICFRLQILLNHSKGVLKVNVRNRSGRTPLHQLLEAQNHDTWGLQRTADLQRRYRVKRRALLMLIRAGADTTARVVPSLQESPLYTWRNGTNDDGLQHVFEPNVGETVDDETLGDTPLHLACREMEPAVMLNLLLRHGAAVYVNSVSRHQRLTPLMMVVGLASAQALPWASMAEAVQVLLDAGADIHLRDSNGRTAWELAMKMCGTSHPWALAPWLEQLMPEMSDEKKQEVLGLGATKRTALGLKKS